MRLAIQITSIISLVIWTLSFLGVMAISQDVPLDGTTVMSLFMILGTAVYNILVLVYISTEGEK